MIPFDKWRDRGAKQSSYLIWRGLVTSIPVEWKEILIENTVNEEMLNECGVELAKKIINIKKVTQKVVKDVIRETKLLNTELICKVKFKSIHPEMNDNCIESSLTLARNLCLDNKIFEMQFKIMHRIIGTNKLLYKINKIESPACTHCHMYPETIEHLFYDCFIIKNFWFNLFELWNGNFHKNIHIEKFHVTFGLENDEDCNFDMENIFILYVKNIFINARWKKLCPE